MDLKRTKYLSKDKQPPGIIRKRNTSENPGITLISYNKESVSKKELKIIDIENLLLKKSENSWIHCSSTNNHIVLKAIGDKFNIHPLLLENIQNVDQRPRLNDTEDFNFIIIKSYTFDKEKLLKNNIAIIVFPQLIISFSENKSFEDINNRIIEGRGKIRSKKCDYLLYSLLDLISDEYYMVLDVLDQQTIALEETLIKKDYKFDITSYLLLKSQVDGIRRNISPVPSIIEGIINSKSPKINSENIIYYKDLLNVTTQLSDIINSMSSSMDNILNLSINISGFKMNGIMKVLTIISTIFIPLTFIAGIYGMNFVHMPELKHKLAYPIVVFVMCIIVIIMVRFFKKKNWF